MYCSRCGKQIDYDAIVCNECRAKEEAEKLAAQAPVQPAQGYQQEQTSTCNKPLDDGKGKAIAAVVMGAIAAFWSIFAIYVPAFNFAVGFIFFCVPSTVLGILGIVNGAKSIKTFIYVKNQGGSKPVGTLVMGIIGLALGVESLLCVVIGFFSGILALSIYSSMGGYYY